MSENLRRLPPARRAILQEAASEGGFDWLTGNRVHGAACNWLFRKKLVTWGHANRKQVVLATPEGRALLASSPEVTRQGENTGGGHDG